MKKRLTWALAGLMAIALSALMFQGDVGAATTLATNVELRVSGQLTGTVGLATASVPLSISKQIALTNGVGASQADQVYTATYAIGTGATQSIDVKGSLVDALGAAFTPAKLKVVYIYSQAANTTNLTLFGDAASVPILNTAATTMTLLPGGVFLNVQPPLAGIAVTAATADIIKIVNGAGATANVDVILVGTSS
jgi:hypothetical protein